MHLDGPADARTALDAPELTAAEAAELDALARDLVRRWSLEWIFGSDGDASPRLEARGRLEILDAGPSHGLWRVLTDLPEALTSELPDEQPVGLMRTTSADVWHELTLPLSRVRVMAPDTDSAPFALGTFASRVTIVAGNAAAGAASAVRDKLLRMAATMLEADVDDLELADGTVRVLGTDRALGFAEIARAHI